MLIWMDSTTTWAATRKVLAAWSAQSAEVSQQAGTSQSATAGSRRGRYFFNLLNMLGQSVQDIYQKPGIVVKPVLVYGKPVDIFPRPGSAQCDGADCVSCSQSRPCSQDQFCRDGYCRSPGGMGDSCWSGSECRSRICWKGRCSECESWRDCKLSSQYCSEGRCVRKSGYGERCLSDQQCISNRCGYRNTCVQCSRQQDCVSSSQYCDGESGRCQARGALGQQCSISRPCRGTLTCSTASSTCVQCQVDTDCSGNSMRCDTSEGQCVPQLSALGVQCAADANCMSGVCGTESPRVCLQCRRGEAFGMPGSCEAEQFCSPQGTCFPDNVVEGGSCLSGLNEQCMEGLDCLNLVCVDD